MQDVLSTLIFAAGLGQLSVLGAAALVPIQLQWRSKLAGLPRLHRQLFWVYAGYVVLSIAAFGFLSLASSRELAEGSGLARGLCAYIAGFWGIRLALQGVFDVKPFLTAWWLRAGYHFLTMLFCYFTLVFAIAALRVSNLNVEF